MTTKSKVKKAKLRHSEYYDFQGVQDRLYAQGLQGKVFKHLVDIITTPENIKLAYRNLKKNSGSKTAGTDGRTIVHLAKLSEEKLITLVQSKFRWYIPQKVRRVEIPKGDGKMRPLGIPTVLDRLIQQCVLQVLEPICEAKFHENSYGFRPNRSQQNAVAQVMKNMQRTRLHYCVDVDIKGFFDNVSHGKLLKQMWTMGIRDKKLISIISAMLKAEVAGVGFPTKGTPQGGIISPLLSNIVLNEFDWWIASQWENIPTRKAYKLNTNSNGSVSKSNKYTILKMCTKLKYCTAVRYADDFKIFTNSYDSAIKLYYATVDWLKNRLGLDVSPEKSKVINLKEQYSEFLGLKLTLIKRGKKSNGEAKYIVKSHIRDKAMMKIKGTLKHYIHEMQHTKNGKSSYDAVRKYNAYVLGIHDYYKMATCVSLDFRRLSYPVFLSLIVRLKERIKPIAEMRKKKIPYVLPTYIKARYGDSKMLRFVDGNALIPIAYVRHIGAKSKRRDVNPYTPEGRKSIHSNLGINTFVLQELMKNPVRGRSIEFNDNRLSLYCGQLGKCYVTGCELRADDVHCHHKVPVSKGGGDNYQNLVLLTSAVHRLIHATVAETINRYIQTLKLDSSQLKKVNKLRDLAGVSKID